MFLLTGRAETTIVVALFAIEFAGEALLELQAFRASDRSRIIDAIEEQLSRDPTLPSRRRKLLVGISPPWEQVRPIWQLRVGDFRVFYDVDQEMKIVTVRAVRKKGRRVTGEIL